MAAVDVTISGVLFDKLNRTTQNVVLIGEATLTGLAPGGGPVYPPPGGDGRPPWWLPHPEHPIPPRPEHPIVLPPVEPGGPPVDIGRPGDPHPEHPIVLPPPPAGIKPPPPGGGWAYVNQPGWGWGYYPKPTEPGPKT